MKQLFLYIAVVIGMTALVISCSSDDDAAKTSSTTTYLYPSECTGNETISTLATNGVMGPRWSNATGITPKDNNSQIRFADISGRYSLRVSAFDEDAGGCIDNATIITNFGLPSEVNSFKHQLFVTSSTSYTVTTRVFSDAACDNSSQTGFFMKSWDNVTINDNLTIATSAVTGGTHTWGSQRPGPESLSGVGLPDNASRIGMSVHGICAYGGTSAVNTLWNSWISGSPFTATTGTVLDNVSLGGSLATGWNYNYTLVSTFDNDSAALNLGLTGNKRWLITGGDNSTTYPDNLTHSGSTNPTPSGHNSSASTWYQDNASN